MTNALPRYSIALGLILAVAGAAGAARANPPMDAMGPDRVGFMCADMDARQASHIAYLETRLGITDQQRPAFKALADAMKASHEPMKTLCAELSGKPEAAAMPARMERMQKVMEARLAGLAKMVPAMNRFYDTLTPEQKKLADEGMFPGRGKGGHWAMHR